MSELKKCKQVVLNFYNELEKTDSAHIQHVFDSFVSDDYVWKGMHPFYELVGSRKVVETFWTPLVNSFTHLQRRMDVFMAGRNEIDSGQSAWVCSMGHFMGLLDKPWLGIPATRKMSFLRYAEFHRVVDCKIQETALFIDILGVMNQSGVYPLPEQTGVNIINPRPLSNNALMFRDQCEESSNKTMRLISKMCDELVSSGLASSKAELANTWHPHMIWWGPTGIGSTYTFDRYEIQHQGPFASGLKDIQFNGHVARIAEGEFGAWFGWPNLTMTPTGGFLGLPGSNQRVDMRVVDIYRREGDKLAENWVFIDLLYFLAQQGLDPLKRLQEISPFKARRIPSN